MSKSRNNFPSHKGKKPNDLARVAVTQTHSGPLPSPQTLSQYGQVDPDIVKTIVAMAKKEQEMREKALDAEIELERKAVEANVRANEIVLERDEIKYKDSVHLRRSVFVLTLLIVIGTLTAYVITNSLWVLGIFLAELCALAKSFYSIISLLKKDSNTSENKKSN